jgi:4-diphosphocytidyl-2-C-methyl-D-erythritol kinase
MRLRAAAPGKLNLSLFVGVPRPDGYHPLVSVFQSVSLADQLVLELGGDADEVLCPRIEGENLAGRAVARFRDATGWDGPPVRLTIEKRIPVAAGMGGGSADAAAALRLLSYAAGLPVPVELALALGADVPSQLQPGRALVTGIGEHVEPLPPGEPAAFVIVPSQHELSTPAVYAEADRLGLARAELPAAEPQLWVNDLQDAARSLCPSIDAALEAVLAAGAQHALVSGSGPTVFGTFPDLAAAQAAAQQLPGAVAATPVGPEAGAVRRLP